MSNTNHSAEAVVQKLKVSGTAKGKPASVKANKRMHEVPPDVENSPAASKKTSHSI